MNPTSDIFSFPSWLILIIAGLFIIFSLKRLIPKSKVDIKGKYVLITGCDSGFGRKTAIRLDEMGACVLAACLTKEGEQSLKSVTTDNLTTFQMDVTNSQQIQDVYEECKRGIPSDTDTPGGLWGIVNNAGILNYGPIEWTPLAIFKRTADVNLWGMIDVTKTFLPLVKKTRGRVVNFSSIAGLISGNFFGSYSVTKYGVEAFSDALRREMYPWGIKVSMLEPGTFTTNICARHAVEKQLKEGWDKLSNELRNEYGEEYVEKGIEALTGMYRSPHTGQVVDAVVEALTSPTPRDRYLVGLDARFGFAWLSKLPAVVADFIIRVFSKVPVPRGC